MTSHLGYDPEAKNPYYGKPDQEVTDKVSSNFIFDHLRLIIFQYNAWLKEQGDDVRNAPPEVDIGLGRDRTSRLGFFTRWSHKGPHYIVNPTKRGAKEKAQRRNG